MLLAVLKALAVNTPAATGAGELRGQGVDSPVAPAVPHHAGVGAWLRHHRRRLMPAWHCCLLRTMSQACHPHNGSLTPRPTSQELADAVHQEAAKR